jgi:hypothetical protein
MSADISEAAYTIVLLRTLIDLSSRREGAFDA